MNLSRGLIRSSVGTEDLDPDNPTIEVKTPKKFDGLHFENFRVERSPLATKELPNLINKKEGLRLWSLVKGTPIERLGSCEKCHMPEENTGSGNTIKGP